MNGSSGFRPDDANPRRKCSSVSTSPLSWWRVLAMLHCEPGKDQNCPFASPKTPFARPTRRQENWRLIDMSQCPHEENKTTVWCTKNPHTFQHFHLLQEYVSVFVWQHVTEWHMLWSLSYVYTIPGDASSFHHDYLFQQIFDWKKNPTDRGSLDTSGNNILNILKMRKKSSSTMRVQVSNITQSLIGQWPPGGHTGWRHWPGNRDSV